MSAPQSFVSQSNATVSALPNGAGAAALLAAGIGSFALAVLAVAADHITALKAWMIFYKPTGPLSGVTTSAIVIWLFAWAILHARWKRRAVALGPIMTASLVLLALSLLLTFPPVGDLF